MGRMGRVILFCALAAAVGCASRCDVPRVSAGDFPVKLASHAIPSMPARRASYLLNFESATDLAFVDASPPRLVVLDSAVARDGAKSLVIPPSIQSITIKLPALLEGRPFPADWT